MIIPESKINLFKRKQLQYKNFWKILMSLKENQYHEFVIFLFKEIKIIIISDRQFLIKRPYTFFLLNK